MSELRAGTPADVPIGLIARRIWRRVLLIVAASLGTTVALMLMAYGFVDFVGPTLAIVIPLVAASFALGRVARLQILLERRTAELESRNEDLTRFARTVAHDLKGPLAGIAGWAMVAVDGGEGSLDPVLAEALDNVRLASFDAIEVVDGLLALALAHGGQVEPVPVDPRAALDRALERVRRLSTSESGGVELFDDAPAVLGHPVALEAVWANLLSNAMKYGGKPPTVRVTLDVRGGTARFEVTDNGAGVAQGVEPFGEFNASTDSKWSHGLGLPITRHFVERFGGRVGYEAATGGGTTFWFELPTADQPVTS